MIVRFLHGIGLTNLSDAQVEEYYYKRLYKHDIFKRIEVSFARKMSGFLSELLDFGILIGFFIPLAGIWWITSRLELNSVPLQISIFIITSLGMIILLNRAFSYVCLPGDALINTPDGDINIRSISEGDTVWSWSISSKTKTISFVTHHKTLRKDHIFCVLTSSQESAIFTTKYHSFLSSKGWVKCSKLKPGDFLLKINENGSVSFDEVLSIIKTNRYEPVFNIYTTGNHNFLYNGFVAHNFTIFRAARTLFHNILVDRNLSNSKRSPDGVQGRRAQ